MKDSGRPKVGGILLQAGLIDESQLDSALEEQTRSGERLGATLIKLDFVEEKDLVRALAAQFELPVASIAGKRIRSEVLSLLSGEMAHRHRLLPLFTTGEAGQKCLYVGVEEPTVLEGLYEWVGSIDMQLRLVMLAPSELDHALDRWYGSDRVPNFQRETSRPPADSVAADADSVSDREVPAMPPPPSRDGSSKATENADYWTLEDDLEPETGDEEFSECGAPVDPNSALDNLAGDARTRHLVRALTHLLIDKGLITRAEWLQQVQQKTSGLDSSG